MGNRTGESGTAPRKTNETPENTPKARLHGDKRAGKESRRQTTRETTENNRGNGGKLQIADGDLEDREKPPFPKAKRLRQRRSRRQKDEGQPESHEVGGRKFILK